MRPIDRSSCLMKYAAAWLLISLSSMANGLTVDDEASDVSILDQVVVTATRSEQPLLLTPASVTVRTMDDLRRDGFTVGSDEYRGVPGVFFRRGEGDADEFPFVSFRGSVGTEGSLSLIDGIPIVGLYEETELNQIPYAAIERIEIVKGPVSALYGRGGLYGSTNYLTRGVDDESVTARLGLGTDDYRRVDLSVTQPFGEGHGLLLSASYEDNEGWRDQGAREIANAFAKARFALAPSTALTAYINLNDRKSELPNGRPIDGDGNIVSFDGGDEGFFGYESPFNDTRSAMAVVRLEHEFRPTLSATVTTAYRDIERDVFLNFFDAFGTDLSRGVVGFNGFRGDTRQRVGFTEATLNWTPEGHDIIAGVSAEQSRINEFIRWSGQNGFTPECGFTFYLVEVDAQTGRVLNRDNPCFVIDDPLTSDRFRNDYWGAFVQDRITLSDRWTLTLGGRFDSFRRKATYFAIPEVTDGGALRGDANAFSPKAALSYATAWGQWYLAYGRGFNSNFGATFEWDPVQYARPETKPTTLDSFELGAKGTLFDDRITFEAAIYQTKQTNRRQIVPNPAAEEDFTAPFNLVTFGDEFQGRGVELALTLKATDATSMTASYSYLDPKWKDFVIQTFSGPVDYSGNAPTGVPNSLFALSINHPVNEWLDLRANYERYGDYYYTVDNRFRDGGYQLLGLSARVQPASWQGWQLDLSLLNALDENYYFYFGGRTSATYAVPGPPRQLRLTLMATF